MGSSRGRKKTRAGKPRFYLAAAAVLMVLIVSVIMFSLMEDTMEQQVENAGQQLTAYTKEESTAQVFMNGQWYEKRDLNTLLVMGIDERGALTSSNSYNNDNQADFLVLFLTEPESGRVSVIHLNRDTMTDITVLGVTGEAAGLKRGQLALAFNYGRGDHDSSKNTLNTVSRLLYGMEVDHYLTVTMDAVPIMNDWVGGVEVDVQDDFAGVDETLIKGEKIRLMGQQALTYVRTRKGMEDSSNLKRMERQRQYAAQWVESAKEKLNDTDAVAKLVVQMDKYHYSDCTLDELMYFAGALGSAGQLDMYELPGEATQGETFMEYYVDEDAVQDLILQLFYRPVNR